MGNRMKHSGKILLLSLLGLVGGCAAPATTSGQVVVGAGNLDRLSLAFDPTFDISQGGASGLTDYVYRNAPRVQRFAATFSPNFVSRFPAKLAPHGVTVVDPAPGVPALRGAVTSFEFVCLEGPCQTELHIRMELVDKDGKKAWTYEKYLMLEEMDTRSFYYFEDKLIEAMVKDGLLAAAQ